MVGITSWNLVASLMEDWTLSSCKLGHYFPKIWKKHLPQSLSKSYIPIPLNLIPVTLDSYKRNDNEIYNN